MNERGLIIDYLVELCFKFEETNLLTYFKAINILDIYLLRNPNENNIFLTGIVSFWIANKLVNRKSIDLTKIIFIFKNKFSLEEILNKELIIINYLNFDFSSSNILEVFDKIFYNQFLDFRSSEELTILRGNCIILCLILVFDIQFVFIEVDVLCYSILIFIIKIHHFNLYTLYNYEDVDNFIKEEKKIIKEIIKISKLDKNIISIVVENIFKFTETYGTWNFFSNSRIYLNKILQETFYMDFNNLNN